MDFINELREEYQESNVILNRLNQEISNLKLEAKYAEKEVFQKFNYLIEEKNRLKKNHENKLKDIEKYKFQLLELENKLDFQKSEIYELTQEREKLKTKIRKKSLKKIPAPQKKKKIENIKDIRESFGFFLLEDNKNNKNEILKKNSFDEDKNMFENLKKSKKNSEIIYHKLQDEIAAYYNDTNDQINFITNCKNYIYSMNSRINALKQQLRISVVGEMDFNFGKNININVNQLKKEMESILYLINEVNNNLYTIKNSSLKRGENILREIETNLSKINNNKNLKLKFLSKGMDIIENKINSLKQLNQMLQKSLLDANEKGKIIEKKIYYLDTNIEKYMNFYQEGKKKIKEAIHETIRKNGKNIFGSINKSLNDEAMDENDQKNYQMWDAIEEEDDYDEDMTEVKTLIKVKDFRKQIDLFRSSILFNNKNDAKENRAKNPKILSKNWNEVCYIYDDYDVHDINFEIKAVGLQPYSFFDSNSQNFYIGKDIKIIDFEINGKKAKFYFDDYCLDYDINLYNLQTAKIHLKYKERPKFDTNSQDNKDFYNFYRMEYYGLGESLKGQMGKFRIILRGSFEIVKFEDDFFVRNENNKKEKEYIWGGRVPLDGKMTSVTLSKREATFDIYSNIQITSRSGNIRNTTLYIPMEYIGGNNEIINMNYSSPQTKNIYVDENNRRYEIYYKDTGYREGNFILKAEIKNRCYGSWNVDLTDEIIKKYIPLEDQKDKYILEKIARSIIAEYDRNNENNNLSLMDYAKIGKWVYKNIRYDLKYVGRTEMTAMDIYHQKVGVCHHMTRLANALLYSLGYEVIYVLGYASSKLEFDANNYHAWSLVKIKGKWYPFDATWGILSGKLPVSHIFISFFNEGYDWDTFDNIESKRKDCGKFIK